MKHCRHRCKQPACNSMAASRGWCPMHYKRWQLWGDPSCATRKAAALALSAVIAACAAPEPKAEPVCATPPGMILMPIETGAKAMKELKDLDDALDACVKFAEKCRVRSNCS